MAQKIYNVLFLCTGNSARSIFAEAYINARHNERFRAYSAGSNPKSEINPLTIEYLRDARIPTEELRPKDWNEFARPNAPEMDFVFTVCDNAAGEVCPVWPGQPVTAHWGAADPAAAEGSLQSRRHAFQTTFLLLQRRIDLLADLRIESLERLALTRNLHEIGKSG